MAVGTPDYSIYPKDIKKLLVSEIQSILFMYSFSEKVPRKAKEGKNGEKNAKN